MYIRTYIYTLFCSVICIMGCPVFHVFCTYVYVDTYTHIVKLIYTNTSNIMNVHAYIYHHNDNILIDTYFLDIISFNVPLVQILVHAMSVTAVLYVALVTMKPVLEKFQGVIPSPQTVWRQLLTPYCLFSRLKTMKRLLVLLSGY